VVKVNWIVVLALAVAAFFFLSEDMVFFAVLCVVGLVLALYYYSIAEKSGAGAAGEYAAAAAAGEREGPLIVKVGGKHKKPPSLYKVRVYPTWENRSAWEEFGKNYLGPTLNSIGGTIFRLGSGKHSERGMDIQPDEMMRGR